MSSMNASKKTVLALPLHYTSSRYGLSGHPGFQTRAMSSTIRPEEQRMIEQLGIYHPPRDCPIEPDQEQISELFPVAYRSVYLETGRLALVRSVYVGKDYTGRWGNYFAHALLFEQLPKAIWPVDLYEWKGWISSLHKSEDVEQTTLELSAINFYPDESAFSFTELQEFLKESDNRLAHLREMIQAVFLRKETSRSIVIREEFEANGLFWIACIQKSFPAICQNNLGCSSYQFDPRACLEVNAVYGETDFSLGENERKYQFYVFDFIDGTHSNVDDSYKEYASVISTWMYENPENIQKFYTFAGQFTLSEINSDLLLALRLYRLSIGDELSLADADLIDILSFVDASAKRECFGDIFNTIESLVRRINKSHNPEHISQLILFFINSAEKTGDPGAMVQTYPLFLTLLDKCIFEKEFPVDQLDSLRSKAKSVCGAFNIEFSQIFLSQKHMSIINENINRLDDEGVLFCMSEFIAALSITTTIDEDEIINDNRLLDYTESVLSMIVPDLSNLDWLFSPFRDSISAHAALCVHVCNVLERLLDSNKITQNQYNNANHSFSIFLSNQLQSKGDVFRFKVINQLKHNEILWKLLEEEYKQGMSMDMESISLSYEKYCCNVFDEKCAFSVEFKSDFAEILWRRLSDKQQLLKAKEWINTDYIKYFSGKLLPNIFDKINENISFDPKDTESNLLSKLIDKAATNFNIELKPNRSLLRNVIVLAENSDGKLNEEYTIDALQEALSGIEERDYTKFLSFYLSKVMAIKMTPEQHGIIVKSVILNKYNGAFLDAYQRFFNRGKKNKFDALECSILEYWVSLKENSEGFYPDKNLLVKIRSLLAKRIAKLDEKSYEALKRICEDKADTPDKKTVLKDVFGQAEDMRNTLIRQVGKTFKSCLGRINEKLKSRGDG